MFELMLTAALCNWSQSPFFSNGMSSESRVKLASTMPSRDGRRQSQPRHFSCCPIHFCSIVNCHLPHWIVAKVSCSFIFFHIMLSSSLSLSFYLGRLLLGGFGFEGLAGIADSLRSTYFDFAQHKLRFVVCLRHASSPLSINSG